MLGVLPVLTSRAQTSPDKTEVKGTFLGNGKDGKLQFLIVQTTEPFSDKAAIKLVFTEKNPSSSKKPDWDAGFKKLGSALVLSVHKDGGVFGCEVAHSTHQKSPFSSVGRIKITDFKVTETQVSGHITTGGEAEFFGQTWDVDLTFSAPLPKGAFAEVSEPKPAASKKQVKADDGDEDDEKPVDAGPKPPVEKLPLPTAARDVEYKKIVEQIAFSADAPVSTVANDFSAKLKKDGWKEDSGGVMSKSSAILRRKLNGADLTIMVKAAGKGCTVSIFTKGMDWSNPPASAEPKPAKGGDEEDTGAEAKRLINDALKQVPRIKF